MREIQWGSFHLQEDKKEEDKKLEMLIETMIALINPTAYKKIKDSKNEQNTYHSDNFLEKVMKETGMSEEEARKFMEDKDSKIKNEELDIVLPPFEL